MSREAAIAAARTLLPWWVGWLNVLIPAALAFVASAASTWCAARVARLVVGRRQTSTWPDGARLVFPVRRAVGFTTILAVLVSGTAVPNFQGALTPVPDAVSIALTLLCVLAGVRVTTHRLSRELESSRRSLLAWGREIALWMLVFVPYWLIAGVAACVTSDAMDGRTLAVLAVAALGFLAFGAGAGLALARALALARPPSARLAAIVGAAGASVRVKPRATYELDMSMANAVAFPIGRCLGVTTRAMEVLDDPELTALCMHELGHLNEPLGTRIARLASVLLWLPVAALRVLYASFGMVGPASAWLFLVLAQRALGHSRRRLEERADAMGHAHEGTAGTYARALERLYETNRIPLVLAGRATTHPHLYDRLTAAGAPPPFPRPRPPSRLPTLFGALAGASVAFLLAVGVPEIVHWRLDRAPHSRPNRLWHVVLRGGYARDLADLGRFSEQEASYARAVTLYRAASAVYPESLVYRSSLARALAENGECGAARQSLSEARGMVPSDRRTSAERAALRQAVVAGVCRRRAAGPHRPSKSPRLSPGEAPAAGSRRRPP